MLHLCLSIASHKFDKFHFFRQRTETFFQIARILRDACTLTVMALLELCISAAKEVFYRVFVQIVGSILTVTTIVFVVRCVYDLLGLVGGKRIN